MRPLVAALAVVLAVASCTSTPVTPSVSDAAVSVSVSPDPPDRSAAPTSATVTPPYPITAFGTIPPNDVVGYDEPTWQQAASGIWGHPYLTDYTMKSGFIAHDPGTKVLWWITNPGNDRVVLT
ncbi:MAG: hypothetical protein ACRDGI_01755 [Candidatus Limnocylindrales bacterium]